MKSPATAAKPRCLVLRVLLAPTEDALDHGSARLGDVVADVAGRAFVNGAGPPQAGLGQGVVLGDVRRDVHSA